MSQEVANITIIAILKKALGLDARQERPPYHDLDDLSGTWTVAEAKEFDRHLAEQRQIEEGLWK